jgi:hypothetical protein
MIDIKELRRLVQAATPGPWKLLPVGDKSKCFAVADINFLSVLTVVDECGTSFGAVYLDGDAKFIAAANPATVSELLDRLEAAESDALEQARLNGMGASREASLMAKLEAAEKEVAHIKEVEFPRKMRAVAAGWETKCARLEQERDELLARIEERERQEPVGTLHDDGCFVWSTPRPYESNYAGWKMKLYLAPGAQPAPSVPEDVMRDAERYRYLRARDDGTAGVGCWIEAKGRACDRGWLYGDQLDGAIDTCIEMLAAAPEAKPCP